MAQLTADAWIINQAARYAALTDVPAMRAELARDNIPMDPGASPDVVMASVLGILSHAVQVITRTGPYAEQDNDNA